MPDVRALARDYGVRVELSDLGDWGNTSLIAEYDPDGPAIRINRRALPAGSSCEVRDAIDRAIAHELYHHREAICELPRLPDRRAREQAADAYAESLLTLAQSPSAHDDGDGPSARDNGDGPSAAASRHATTSIARSDPGGPCSARGARSPGRSAFK